MFDNRLRFRLLILAAVVGAVWLLHRQLDLWQYFAADRIGPTLSAVRSWLEPYGVWGPVLFAAACSAAMLLNVPSALIICLSVILFGPVAGGLLSFAILGAGLSLIYAIAQWLGRPLVKQLFGEALEKLEKLLTRRELVNVIVVRLVLYMNPATNWLLSVSGVRYRNLMLGTLLGAGPGILINIWLAGAVVEYFQARERTGSLDARWLVAVAAAVLSFFALRWWGRRKALG